MIDRLRFRVVVTTDQILGEDGVAVADSAGAPVAVYPASAL